MHTRVARTVQHAHACCEDMRALVEKRERRVRISHSLSRALVLKCNTIQDEKRIQDDHTLSKAHLKAHLN